MDTLVLIAELQHALRDQLQRSERLRQFPIEVLQQRPTAKRWSVLEVVEHMNLSSGHYYRRLQALYTAPQSTLRSTQVFLPGRFGELATKAMQPAANGDISWKMRTLFMFEPRTAKTKGLLALDEFEAMLRGFLELLEIAKVRGLEGKKVTSTLGPILRFKPGDALRFPIAHQERHMLQIDRVLSEVRSSAGPIDRERPVFA